MSGGIASTTFCIGVACAVGMWIVVVFYSCLLKWLYSLSLFVVWLAFLAKLHMNSPT